MVTLDTHISTGELRQRGNYSGTNENQFVKQAVNIQKVLGPTSYKLYFFPHFCFKNELFVLEIFHINT